MEGPVTHTKIQKNHPSRLQGLVVFHVMQAAGVFSGGGNGRKRQVTVASALHLVVQVQVQFPLVLEEFHPRKQVAESLLRDGLGPLGVGDALRSQRKPLCKVYRRAGLHLHPLPAKDLRHLVFQSVVMVSPNLFKVIDVTEPPGPVLLCHGFHKGQKFQGITDIGNACDPRYIVASRLDS